MSEHIEFTLPSEFIPHTVPYNWDVENARNGTADVHHDCEWEAYQYQVEPAPPPGGQEGFWTVRCRHGELRFSEMEMRFSHSTYFSRGPDYQKA